MAWITKNSAGAVIERRAEPYLDEAFKAKLETEIVSRYPTRRAATLPVLHAVQDVHGWLPAQAVTEVAEFLGVPPSETLDTATFYDQYWLKPRGKYVIWACQSLSCEIMGSEPLTERIKRKLGIEVGETTEDGKFTLMRVECIGSCGTAPCALVNQKLHENLTADNFEQILDALE